MSDAESQSGHEASKKYTQSVNEAQTGELPHEKRGTFANLLSKLRRIGSREQLEKAIQEADTATERTYALAGETFVKDVAADTKRNAEKEEARKQNLQILDQEVTNFVDNAALDSTIPDSSVDGIRATFRQRTDRYEDKKSRLREQLNNLSPTERTQNFAGTEQTQEQHLADVIAQAEKARVEARVDELRIEIRQAKTPAAVQRVNERLAVIAKNDPTVLRAMYETFGPHDPVIYVEEAIAQFKKDKEKDPNAELNIEHSLGMVRGRVERDGVEEDKKDAVKEEPTYEDKEGTWYSAQYIIFALEAGVDLDLSQIDYSVLEGVSGATDPETLFKNRITWLKARIEKGGDDAQKAAGELKTFKEKYQNDIIARVDAELDKRDAEAKPQAPENAIANEREKKVNAVVTAHENAGKALETWINTDLVALAIDALGDKMPKLNPRAQVKIANFDLHTLILDQAKKVEYQDQYKDVLVSLKAQNERVMLILKALRGESSQLEKEIGEDEKQELINLGGLDIPSENALNDTFDKIDLSAKEQKAKLEQKIARLQKIRDSAEKLQEHGESLLQAMVNLSQAVADLDTLQLDKTQNVDISTFPSNIQALLAERKQYLDKPVYGRTNGYLSRQNSVDANANSILWRISEPQFGETSVRDSIADVTRFSESMETKVATYSTSDRQSELQSKIVDAKKAATGKYVRASSDEQQKIDRDPQVEKLTKQEQKLLETQGKYRSEFDIMAGEESRNIDTMSAKIAEFAKASLGMDPSVEIDAAKLSTHLSEVIRRAVSGVIVEDPGFVIGDERKLYFSHDNSNQLLRIFTDEKTNEDTAMKVEFAIVDTRSGLKPAGKGYNLSNPLGGQVLVARNIATQNRINALATKA